MEEDKQKEVKEIKDDKKIIEESELEKEIEEENEDEEDTENSLSEIDFNQLNSLEFNNSQTISTLETIPFSQKMTLEQDISFVPKRTEGVERKEYDENSYNTKYSEDKYNEQTPSYVGKSETNEKEKEKDQ